MEDEDDAVMEETEEARDPQKWSWLSFWSLVVAAVSGYWHLWATFFAGISALMDQHQEWKDSREQFAEGAAREIEALTATIKAP